MQRPADQGLMPPTGAVNLTVIRFWSSLVFLLSIQINNSREFTVA